VKQAERGEPAAIERLGQATDLPLDAHLHTDLSPDSNVPIDVYAALAAERGIAEIAITDHVDFLPGYAAYGYSTFEERERSVRQAAERWAERGVTIRFGCELTYERAVEDDVRAHLERHRYDYTIGSVHQGSIPSTTPSVSPRGAVGGPSARSSGRTLTRSWQRLEVVSSTRSGTSTW
jgi:histidinol phosphatase-like PHP family hydrolase